MRWPIPSVLIAVAPVTVSCGQADCDSVALSSLAITVTLPDGTRICDANVSAVDGDEVFDLEAFPGPDCSYFGPFERPGNYVITVTRGDDVVMTDRIEVDSDECHVKTRSVDVVLAS